MKPKVVLLATGGTIASRYDPALGRTVASQRAEDLLRMLPQLSEVAELEVENYATIASFDMSVAFAFGLIEAFGRGNGPTGLTELVRRAVQSGVVVLVTSRCPEGRVEPLYGGGGGRDLADAGALFVGDLKGPKARLLLMVLLSSAEGRSRIAETVAALAP